MRNEFTKSDFESLDKLRNDSSASLPLNIMWYSAIDASNASDLQRQSEHRHKSFELHFVLNGSMVYRFNGTNIVEVKQNDMLIVAPDRLHKIDFFSRDFLKFSITFDINRSEKLYDLLLQKSGIALQITDTVRNHLLFCIAEAKNNSLYSSVLIKNRLFEMLCHIANTRSKNSQEKTTVYSSDTRLEKAKMFIADNPDRFFTCEEIASYCYLSVKQLNRLFLKYERTSLLSYIHNKKINDAKMLLQKGDLNSVDVSEKLGFSSVYYFNRFFSKHTGKTPGEYRKDNSTE